MSTVRLELQFGEEDVILFKRSVRKLLESTFILREKDERLYGFLSRESNRIDTSEYLRLIGFDLLVDDKVGVAMLTASEADADTVGLKRANVVSFDTLQYHLLLVLWEIYLENLGYQEGNFISRGDLIDKIKAYGIFPGVPEFRRALKLFKRYSLIDYNERETDEEALIRLYPSLQFGWDLPQFRTVADQYLETQGEEGTEESPEESADPDAQEEHDEAEAEEDEDME